MGTSKILKIFFLVFGIIYTCTESAPADSSPQSDLHQNIQNAIHKLNAQFSSALLKETKPEGNVLFSPLNVYTALALLHLGATGSTKSELSTALGIPSDDHQLLQTHESFGKLLNDIQNTSAAQVSVANGVFARNGLKLKDTYQLGSNKYYKSEVQSVDFAKGGNEATDTVNKWISSKTKQRIPKLLQSEISPATQLLLASALFFNATWSNTFSKFSTKLEKFDTGLKEVDVQTMNKKSSVSYINNEALKFEAISLPYLYNEFALAVILPHKNKNLKALVDVFKPQDYLKLIEEFSSESKNTTYVDYKIPRLKFKWSQSINRQIIDFGIKNIFQNAQLDNLVEGKTPLAVSDVTHATEIELDEEGTTATAVTVIQITRTLSLPIELQEPRKFYVNRPFQFIIYHPVTRVIIFTGMVHNPAEGA